MNDVVPVPKPGRNKAHIDSYRPICLQPIISKLFEKIVNHSLRNHLRGIIHDQQHGFMSSRSTATNLLCYKDFITSALDENSQVHSIYTDFEKAFDSISHEYLILKLENQFGIVGNNLKWFHSYLQERYQRVVLNGSESHWILASSGVPQGSILGSSLFIMYVDDVTSCLQKSESLLFADDFKIFKIIKSLSDCIDLQGDLMNFRNWCIKWKLSLNIQKCCFVNFSLKRKFDISYDYHFDGNVIKKVDEIKDLGVYFTSNLCFNRHISFIVTKSFRMLGFIKRVTHSFKDICVLKVLYNSYVRSNLDYCSQVWSPNAKCAVNKIERIQKAFVKFLCFHTRIMYKSDNYAVLCHHFRLTTLAERREISDILLFHKIVNSAISCNYLTSAVCLKVPGRITRNTGIFTSKRKSRLLLRKHAFFPRTFLSVNKFKEIDVFSASLSTVKRFLIKHFT